MTELAAPRTRLGLMVAENLSVAAAFGLSYSDLTEDQQRLFRRLGLYPGPDIDAHAAAALDDTTARQARRGLEGLYDQHLITQPAPGRYRFHDLLRQHARALAAADNPAEPDAASGRLLDYYVDAALAAAGLFTAHYAHRAYLVDRRDRDVPGHPAPAGRGRGRDRGSAAAARISLKRQVRMHCLRRARATSG